MDALQKGVDCFGDSPAQSTKVSCNPGEGRADRPSGSLPHVPVVGQFDIEGTWRSANRKDGLKSLIPMESESTPDNFEALSSKLQELADTLKNCHDPQERVVLLKEFRRFLDRLYKLNEKALWKSD